MRFGDSHEPLKNMNENCVTQYLLQQVKEIKVCFRKSIHLKAI